MRFTFSRNPIDRLSCWITNNIEEPISRYYFKKKKSHYRCCVCGQIVAPYFETHYHTANTYCSLSHDYGWHKLKGRYGGWVCHHCADHGFSPSSENGKPFDWEHPRECTWDEWQEYVKENNKQVLQAIKEKDLEYYKWWFEDEQD